MWKIAVGNVNVYGTGLHRNIVNLAKYFARSAYKAIVAWNVRVAFFSRAMLKMAVPSTPSLLRKVIPEIYQRNKLEDIPGTCPANGKVRATLSIREDRANTSPIIKSATH